MVGFVMYSCRKNPQWEIIDGEVIRKFRFPER